MQPRICTNLKKALRAPPFFLHWAIVASPRGTHGGTGMIEARIYDSFDVVRKSNNDSSVDDLTTGQSYLPSPPTPSNDQTFKRTKFATVYADGKAKRYSTRRSSAWKAVSRRITTFQGSGYMDFTK